MIILINDSFNDNKPAISIIIPITIAVKYYILPCPYGCSLSGALFDKNVPIIVIVDDKASVKLFIASSIIAIEFANNPIIILNVTKRILVIIP